PSSDRAGRGRSGTPPDRTPNRDDAAAARCGRVPARLPQPRSNRGGLLAVVAVGRRPRFARESWLLPLSEQFAQLADATKPQADDRRLAALHLPGDGGDGAALQVL